MHALHFIHIILKNMHESLRRLDLNLLLVFDALHRHRSVVAAADELSMSPSACSHALSRLRSTLADDLFVRIGSIMRPTAQAEDVAEGIADALRILSDKLGGSRHFSPATCRQTFIFAATDFTAFALLPLLIARLESQAPHLRTKVVYSTQRDPWRDLSEGRVHFVLGISDEYSAAYDGIEALDCFSDDYVVAARQDHPRIRDSLSIEQYIAERHVVVVPWSDAGSVIDSALTRLGHMRDVSVQLPSVMAAPFIVANSNLLITLPRRAALQLNRAAPLKVYPAPFDTPRYTLKMFFHVRHSSTPGHDWIRAQMLLALSE